MSTYSVKCAVSDIKGSACSDHHIVCSVQRAHIVCSFLVHSEKNLQLCSHTTGCTELTCSLVSALCTVICVALCTVHCGVYTLHCALCIVDCTHSTVHCALWSVHTALCTVHYHLCSTVHCELWSVHTALCTVHCSLRIRVHFPSLTPRNLPHACLILIKDELNLQ